MRLVIGLFSKSAVLVGMSLCFAMPLQAAIYFDFEGTCAAPDDFICDFVGDSVTGVLTAEDFEIPSDPLAFVVGKIQYVTFQGPSRSINYVPLVAGNLLRFQFGIVTGAQTIGGDPWTVFSTAEGLWFIKDYDNPGTCLDFPCGPGAIALRATDVQIDIKFCSDPNAFNCKKKGVLPVTIFGTEDFLVQDIDPGSLQLCTEDLSACTGAPRVYSYADRGDPTSDLGAAMCAIDPDTGEEVMNQDGFLDLDAAFEASEVQEMLGMFCYLDKGAISESLILTGETYDGMAIYSVPMDDVGIDQLLKVNKSSVMVDCPCWSDADILALPMAGTDAMCTSDGGRLDIWQDGLCEHSYGVGISPTGYQCVTNRFSCPGLPDLGGEWIETSEIEFASCLAQIVGRCQELGIDPPEFP
ncbi:MAG: hypothetical protein OEU52_08825 [Xanthomonadales bacterium]|nr:hypothetical protein [Xanthomonadales bacterium]